MNLEEVRDMYARSLSKRGRSTPPPGYAGTAFVPSAAENPSRDPGDMLESKRHTPEEYGANRPVLRADLPPVPAGEGRGIRVTGESRDGLPAAFSERLSDLRGRVGTEEVILLMVMLLLSADGAGIETLLLGLILLAGRGD